MKTARVLITPEILCDLLHLPPTTQIRGASFDTAHRFIEFVVEDPALPEVTLVEGERPPLMKPRFRKQEPIVFEGWREP